MFDKILYDRNAYNRSVASEGLGGSITASGDIRLSLQINTPIVVNPILGSGTMGSSMVIRTFLSANLSGSGNLVNSGLIMKQQIKSSITASGNITRIDFLKDYLKSSITASGSMKVEFLKEWLRANLNGSGDATAELTIKTPIGAQIQGEGHMKSERDYVLQHMSAKIMAHGDIKPGLVVRVPLSANINGSGDLDSTIILHLPLRIPLSGSGDLDCRRLGALNENTFELMGINLLPGEEVIIDTDTLDVFFNHVRDVTSVSTDSVFFELAPGENEITIASDKANAAMQVVAIWQNRWL